jgi:hypothetical protein
MAYRLDNATHSLPSLPVASAAMAKANGTLQLIRPASSIGGCIRIPSSYNRGFRPTPSTGARGSASNGVATKPSKSVINASTVISTATTYGMKMRWGPGLRCCHSTTAEKIESVHAQYSREPCWPL